MLEGARGGKAARASLLGLTFVAIASLPVLRRDAPDTTTPAAAATAPASVPESAEPPILPRRSPIDAAVEAASYETAARSAYASLLGNRTPTGLVKATEEYDNVTTWDIGGLILGLHSALELGIAPREEMLAWMRTVLQTLNEAPLFDDRAYNKSYAATNGQMIGSDDKPSSRGKGWSSTDLGRLLIALRVAEQHPELADLARSAAQRIDFARVVREGYLYGEEPRSTGNISYVEGRVGYEQYAALGFSLWGHRAESALDVSANSVPVTVMGRSLLADKRGSEQLTSEPLVLMGMELGWAPPFRELAASMLEVQEARYQQTGQVTIVSEDALPHPPHFFYYYDVWSAGSTFVVRAQGPAGDVPRWVSAKAAYAWHALVPNGYTWRAVTAVEPARSGAGWASGIYEGNGRSTGVRNLNSAAVILEAALYRQRGRPLVEAAVGGGS